MATETRTTCEDCDTTRNVTEYRTHTGLAISLCADCVDDRINEQDYDDGDKVGYNG